MRPDGGRADGRDDDGAAMDSRGQAEIEGRAGAEAAGREDASPGSPPAGPHGAPELTEPAATPGAGALPDVNADDEADAATC